MNEPRDYDAEDREDGDFSDMLSEMRILLPGAQMLSAFLVILPFNEGFGKIVHAEKLLFLATFFFSLTALVLLSAPAVQHRVMRPLKDRARFKRNATRQIVAGAFSLGIALTLGTDLVISEVFGATVGFVMAAIMAAILLCFWWLVPALMKRNDKE
jgi:SNF family Na+-dependent transporter